MKDNIDFPLTHDSDLGSLSEGSLEIKIPDELIRKDSGACTCMFQGVSGRCSPSSITLKNEGTYEITYYDN